MHINLECTLTRIHLSPKAHNCSSETKFQKSYIFKACKNAPSVVFFLWKSKKYRRMAAFPQRKEISFLLIYNNKVLIVFSSYHKIVLHGEEEKLFFNMYSFSLHLHCGGSPPKTYQAEGVLFCLL